MSGETERFDVRLCEIPARTPAGFDFASELARMFAVELWVAEHIARHTPTFVKRDVTASVAEEMRAALERLGARVEVLPTAVAPTRPATWPPGLPPGSPHAASPSSPPSGGPRRWASPPPRSSMRPYASTAPTSRPLWTPVPPPEPANLRPTFVTWLLAAVVLVAIGYSMTTRWLRHAADGRMLGTLPNEATPCTHHFGLTGVGADVSHRAPHTLVVAWHEACPGEGYRRYLDDLASTHRGELAVLGAALVAPNGGAPLPWPLPHCSTGFDVLPLERGYVNDALEEPATYLYDEHGNLVAAWRGEMSTEQRQRLSTWLEGGVWDR